MISLFAFCIIVFSAVDSYSEIEIDRTVLNGGNGRWYIPWESGFSGYNHNRSTDATTGQVTVTISCWGNGSQKCPISVLKGGMPLFGEITGGTSANGSSEDPFIDETSPMDCYIYVKDQVENNVFSGSASIDMVHPDTNIMYHRNVSWDGDNIQGNITIEIYPY